MLVGDWQLWDVGEVAAAAASSCGDMGLADWLESTGLQREREREVCFFFHFSTLPYYISLG